MVRMFFKHEHEYANQSAASMAIAPKIGCGRDTPWRWVKQSDIDSGRKEGQPPDERAQIKAMDRQIRDLRLANEILRKASAYFAPALIAASDCRAAGRSSPPIQTIITFIEDHNNGFGVEPICTALPIAQSTFYSPHSMRMLRSSNTQTWRPIVPKGTRICAPRSNVFGKRTMKSTAPERSGIKCSMRRSLLRAALRID